MFGTIRKHSTWLWMVIIVVIIISFVVYFTPNVGRNGPTTVSTLGSIDGKPVTREEYFDAQDEARLAFLFNTGNWPGRGRMDDQRLNQETRFRLFMARKAQELGIEVSEEAIAKWIKSSGAFNDRQTGAFSKPVYEAFLNRTLAEQGLGLDDFTRYIRHELAMQQITALFSASGRLITPNEAEQAYKEMNEQFVTDLVVFNAEDFASKVATAQTNLMQYYTNNRSRYLLPDRVVVRFVKFDFTNYTAAAAKKVEGMTNLAMNLDAIYQQRGSNAYLGTNNLPLPPELAKLKIKDEIQEEFARREAREAAGFFLEKLEEIKPVAAGNLATLAAKEGLKVSESKPFAEFDFPPDLKVMENFARSAFALTAEEPFAGPILGEDAAFVIALERRLPGGELPPLESQFQRVMDDYRAIESAKLATKAGEEFAAKVKEGLAAKKSFADICAAAKVKPISVPAFSPSTRSLPEVERLVSLFELQGATRSLKPGEASGYQAARDGGFVVYLQARRAADPAKMKEEMPTFLEQLRRARQSAAFEEWVMRASAGMRLDIGQK
jgi:hypothetical protein